MLPQYNKKPSWFPGFKILDRYILGKFVGTYLFAIAMIIVIVVVFDYVEKVDDFIQMQAPVKAIIFDYYFKFVPFFINQFSALFTFIAVIFFTSKLAYQTEIVAMLSGGMSFRRLMWPYFLGALFITALSLLLSLWIIPMTQKDCVAFEQKYIARRVREQYDRHIYRQVEPGKFAYIRGFSKNTSVASFFALEQYEGSTMVGALEASDVKFDPESKHWTAQRYITRTFDDKGDETFTQHRNLDTVINLDVVELGRLTEFLTTMNIVELNDFLAQQRDKGSDSIRQIEVERHIRFSYPFGTFILTLIGVALSSRKVRGGTGLHIGIGITLCFSYIMLTRVFEEFAKGGSMPTMIAVWLPNIIFLIIGIYLYRKAPK
ncbi:MAG: LptF/LptG family permease [Alistipes sp.]|nr:LptF/LptG family permease [Alistipes sp.]